MRNRRNKAEYLLREIGEIDDRLVAEALSHRGARRKTTRAILLAACLSLVFVLTVILPFYRVMSGILQNATPDDESPQEILTLDGVLEQADGYLTELESLESLSYTDGPRLVWQNVESGEIFVCELTAYQLSRLQREMGRGQQVGEQSPDNTCLIWVLDGEGGVRTPYLKQTPGNEGCTVFEYDPEILPTQNLITCISDILS